MNLVPCAQLADVLADLYLYRKPILPNSCLVQRTGSSCSFAAVALLHALLQPESKFQTCSQIDTTRCMITVIPDICEDTASLASMVACLVHSLSVC